MSGPKYLRTPIAAMVSTAEVPRYGMARDGYTLRSGAPSSRMVRLEGETRWRRLMVWCFSNSGTCFVRVKGECLIVPEHTLPPESHRNDYLYPWRVLVSNRDGSRPDSWQFATAKEARSFARGFAPPSERRMLRIRVRHVSNLPLKGSPS